MNIRRSIALVTLFAASCSSFAEVVIETDDNLATFTGTWTKSAAIQGYYGSGFATAPVGAAAQSARFVSPKAITSTGTWCVQARWTAATNRSAAAKYEIYDATTLRSTVTVDQRSNGGAWRTLACVPMTAGRTSEVRLLNSSGATSSLVVADAVRWVWEENSAQSLCVNVAGGQAGGGGTFVAQGLSIPASGTCKPWSGFLKTATDVVGFTSGTGCTSSDGKVFTATLASTNPSFFGPGTVATDHVQLCTAGCPTGVTQSDTSSYFGSTTAARVTCTATMLTLPSVHN